MISTSRRRPGKGSSWPVTFIFFIPAFCIACTTPGREAAAPEAEATPPQAQASTAEDEVPAPGPSPDEIVAAVQAEDTAIRQCYLLGSFKNAQLAGTVKVAFTIQTNGKVGEVEDAGSNVDDQEVVDCVLQVFAKLEFRPGGVSATSVTYPVNFGEQG